MTISSSWLKVLKDFTISMNANQLGKLWLWRICSKIFKVKLPYWNTTPVGDPNWNLTPCDFMFLNARPHRILLNLLLLYPPGWWRAICWYRISLQFLVLAQFGLHDNHQDQFPLASTCWRSRKGDLGCHCWALWRHLVVPCLFPSLFVCQICNCCL